MFSTATYTATEPVRYATTVRATSMELLRVGRGDFWSQTTRVDLDRLWMQRADTNLPYTGRSTIGVDRVIMTFLRPSSSPMLRLGTDVLPGQITAQHSQQPISQRMSGPKHTSSLSLTREDFAHFGQVLTGRELDPLTVESVLTPPPHLMAHLHRLYESTLHLAQTEPDALAQPEAAHGLEQQLIQALFACLAHGEDQVPNTVRRKAEVLARFERVVGDNPDKALYLPDVCAAVGVPGRTLRLYCTEHLGMSPKRYLDLRRMYLARRALTLLPAGSVTVTRIATHYGFWELSRFATAYQSFFGELPSATLRRQAEIPAGRENFTAASIFAKIA
jgi:AraC-like DNA-binding protein